MSDIDPRRGGKCWSCRYCEDVGTYGYEDSTFYMRKCNNSRKEYVADCERYCSDYIWDGKTTEYWRESSSSSSYSSSSSSSSSSLSSSGGGGCFGIIATVVVIGAFIFFGLNFVGDLLFVDGGKSSSSDTKIESVQESKTGTVIPAEGLRLRSGPGTSYNKILTMQKGETVKVIEVQGDWVNVDYKGTVGWCSAEYLRIN